jgi:hypothetical protein
MTKIAIREQLDYSMFTGLCGVSVFEAGAGRFLWGKGVWPLFVGIKI